MNLRPSSCRLLAELNSMQGRMRYQLAVSGEPFSASRDCLHSSACSSLPPSSKPVVVEFLSCFESLRAPLVTNLSSALSQRKLSAVEGPCD